MSTVARGTVVLLSQGSNGCSFHADGRGSTTSHAYGVETSVDVHDLAGGGGEPVRQQGDDGLARGLGVGDRPAQRGAALPRLLELVAARDGLHGHAAQRPGGDEVGADAV